MRGPDAEARRADFEAWLDEGALHREAYNRIAETFSLGKALKNADFSAHNPARAPAVPKGTIGRMALIAALLAFAAVGAVMIWAVLTPNQAFRPGSTLAQGNGEVPQQRLATRFGEIRQFRLADGSIATLDTDSLLLASFSIERRDLTLVRGRARFAVAHETRPFLVAAGGGSVKAVGTVFDVGLTVGGRVDVRLLKGAIEVAVESRTNRGEPVRRLVTGQALSFGGSAQPRISILGKTGDANWPAGLRDFDGVRVADVIADANRYASVPLRVATPDIANARISGTFRVDESVTLAANIADVLGLAQVTDADGIALVRTCPPSTEKNCRPPS
ncbi:FecR domain-containing protein [Novosphingobium sp. G106]|nr:FecR domain-containing protein [Novosphingobium sp. G106]